jgi:hypothetical protein
MCLYSSITWAGTCLYTQNYKQAGRRIIGLKSP